MKIHECPTTKVCNICNKEKPVTEFYIRKEHVQKYCLDCKRAKNRSHYKENPEAYKVHAKQWANDNIDRRREIVNSYDSRNRESIREYHAGRKDEVNAGRREDYADNPIEGRQAANKWYHANKHRDSVKAARNEISIVRNRKAKHATPDWSNIEYIKMIYTESRYRTRTTGVKHNVDHIYPIQSDWVSGLHVPENLRVITAFDNQSKGNKPVEDIVHSVS